MEGKPETFSESVDTCPVPQTSNTTAGVILTAFGVQQLG